MTCYSLKSLPAVRLSRIFRQTPYTSQIVHNAHLLIQGKEQGLYRRAGIYFLRRTGQRSASWHRLEFAYKNFRRHKCSHRFTTARLGIDHLNTRDAPLAAQRRRVISDKLQVHRIKSFKPSTTTPLNVYNGDIGYVRGVGKDEHDRRLQRQTRRLRAANTSVN